MNCEWDNVKNRPQTAEVGFFENRTVKTELSVFEFWGRFGSVLWKTDIRHFHRIPHTPTLNVHFKRMHSIDFFLKQRSIFTLIQSQTSFAFSTAGSIILSHRSSSLLNFTSHRSLPNQFSNQWNILISRQHQWKRFGGLLQHITICLSVCMSSVTLVHPAKAAGWYKMPLGRNTCVVPSNIVLVRPRSAVSTGRGDLGVRILARSDDA